MSAEGYLNVLFDRVQNITKSNISVVFVCSSIIRRSPCVYVLLSLYVFMLSGMSWAPDRWAISDSFFAVLRTCALSAANTWTQSVLLATFTRRVVNSR